MHRDIKPENILIDKDLHCMLADFGLAKLGMDELSQTHTFCGSPGYIAPEVRDQNGYTKAVDIFALGVVLYTMLLGTRPVCKASESSCIVDTTDSTLMKIFNTQREEAKDVIFALTNYNPEQRLGSKSTDDIQHHVFFDSIDFSALERREVPVPDYDSGFLSDENRCLLSTLSENETPLCDRPKVPESCVHVDGWDFVSPQLRCCANNSQHSGVVRQQFHDYQQL